MNLPKKGDRVRFKNDQPPHIRIGKVVSVATDRHGRSKILIKWMGQKVDQFWTHRHPGFSENWEILNPLERLARL